MNAAAAAMDWLQVKATIGRPSTRVRAAVALIETVLKIHAIQAYELRVTALECEVARLLEAGRASPPPPASGEAAQVA